jgi:hypothetical protein
MLYQQLTRGLRWPLGPGQGDFFSERPTDSKGRFTDGEAGTTVEIPEGAPVDVAFLLRIGAIAPLAVASDVVAGHEPPDTSHQSLPTKEAASGEDRR